MVNKRKRPDEDGATAGVGGWRQEMAMNAAVVFVGSTLAIALVKDWAWGLISAVKVQKTAAAAVADHKALHVLSHPHQL